MNILAINTSNIMADIVLLIEQKQVLKKVNSLAKHSESFMPALDEVLNQNKLKVKDLNTLACVVGPGSFTGIRIGVSIAKGFETANENLKLMSITTFELMQKEFLKNNSGFKGEFICVLNALSGKYYTQKFSTENNIFEPTLFEGEFEILKEKVIVGDAQENLEFVTDKVFFETEILKEIVLEKLEKQEYVKELVPLYLRKSQAEDELLKKKLASVEVGVLNESDIEQALNISNVEISYNKWPKENFQNVIKNENYVNIAIKLDKKLIGFGIFNKSIDESTMMLICVENSFKRKNIATKILNSVLEIYKQQGVKKMFLEVSSNNQPAIAFYEKFGFEKLRTRNSYYQDKSDAIEYVLEIK